MSSPNTALLAPDYILEGLFATITFRLEPDGRGTRFPFTMGELYKGRLDPAHVDRVLEELAVIADELHRVPTRRAVWDAVHFRPADDSRLPVRHDARNLFDYFISADNRPLVPALGEWVGRQRNSTQVAELRPRVIEARRKAGYNLLLIGIAWMIIGLLFFPHYVLVPIGSQSHHGPLVWTLGLLWAVLGLAGVAAERWPRLSRRVDYMPVWAWAVVIVCGLAGWGYLSWR